LLRTLPPFSCPRWLYPFQIAAREPLLDTPSLHDVLRRAVEEQGVAVRRKDEGGRWMYARAKQKQNKKRKRR